jgi:hypothetical protein
MLQSVPIVLSCTTNAVNLYLILGPGKRPPGPGTPNRGDSRVGFTRKVLALELAADEGLFERWLVSEIT